MQKITVEVPRTLIADVKKYSDIGISGAVREGLKQFVQRRAQLELLKMRGAHTPSLTAEEMRSWEDG